MKYLKFFEAADVIIYNDNIRLSAQDKDAIPFFYYFKKDGNYRIIMGKDSQEHHDMLTELIKNKEIPKEENRNVLTWKKGRIWTNRKIIGFWQYPDENINKFLTTLEEKSNIDLTKNWMVHVEEKDYPQEIEGEIDSNDGKLIPINKFKGGKTTNIRKLQQHTMTPTEKKKLMDIGREYFLSKIKNIEDFPKDEQEKILKRKSELENLGIDFSKFVAKFGSKKKKDIEKGAWTFAKKFENFKLLKESPDCIYINDKILRWNYNSNYPFYYYAKTGEVFIGDESTSHSELFDKLKRDDKLLPEDKNINWIFVISEYDNEILTYPGRLFVDEKIISFWTYPKTKEGLKEIVTKIEDKTDFNIWNGDWLLEVDHNGNEGKGKLIKLKDFKGSKDVEFENRYHTLSPIEKNKIKNFKTFVDKRPLNWKQALLKSESKSIK